LTRSARPTDTGEETHLRRRIWMALGAVLLAGAAWLLWPSGGPVEERPGLAPAAPAPIAAAPAPGEPPKPSAPASVPKLAKLDLRLVSITTSPDDPTLARASIRDRRAQTTEVLAQGQSLGAYDHVTLATIGEDWVVIEDARRDDARPESLKLVLDRETPLVEMREPSEADLKASMDQLKAFAEAGQLREGLFMAYWGRIGERDEAALLSQGHLAPYYGERATDGSLGNQLLGLKVIKVEPGSFWDQIGLRPGDILHEANGVRLDHTKAYTEMMHPLEEDTSFAVRVTRGDRSLSLRTSTVPPH